MTIAMRVIYEVTEKADKCVWERLGTAVTNRDGTLLLRFVKLPSGDGTVHVRWSEPQESDVMPLTGDVRAAFSR